MSLLLTVIASPRPLAIILNYIPWTDVYSVLSSCRSARSLFRSPQTRDVIFAAFIPGYHFSHTEHDVYLSIHQLDLFLISQKFPLHYYPSYALRSIPEQHLTLAALTQAHSRVVLLLQSLVHRSATPITPEPPQQLAPLPILLRQLTFPAPLSYHPPKPKHKYLPPTPPSLSHRLFRPRPITLPPPPEPLVLKRYTSSWRRHSLSPHRRTPSTDSSTFTSTPSRTATPTPTTASSSSTSSSSPPPLSYTTIPTTSPHSFHFATSPARAPVLRTYVPCTVLTHAISQCEQQLFLSGLWSHLSAGDIVCNLGYVPDDSDDAVNYTHKWLIFNGTHLVLYTPGPLPLPLSDPLSLPSPFYYSHILPSSPLANPVFSISTMPAIRASRTAPAMTLQLLSTKVPSKPSPSGVAIARKYMWTALVRRAQPQEMGEGWYGDWVLEAEGTREGKQMLLDWLGGAYLGPPMHWELVRERSGMGKKDTRAIVWLKLLHGRDERWDDDDESGSEDAERSKPTLFQDRA